MMTKTSFRFHPRVGALLIGLVGCTTAPAGEPTDKPAHTNHLINASSPYLLQHAHNPVDWYSWSDEAFDRAKREDKPIFLSIGYAACHWCHVMERESFENDEVAAVLNEHFISIKVDREERPDIDEIYMAATQAATGRGGWPMSVFMTPDGKPFLCGTYFPPNDRGGRRGFRGLCVDIAEQWRSDRDKLLRDAGSLVRRVRSQKQRGGAMNAIDRATVSRNVQRLAKGFDPVLGGPRSRRNKFPPTMAMELMLRECSTRPQSCSGLLEAVETTLNKMADGGIYDHIGGGICRYSTDPRWFAPHFEKMLYDQGRVVGVYLSAYQRTHNRRYARVARGILDYCINDLQDAGGGFYSSRDADSEGEEGKFYVWRHRELLDLLGPQDGPLFCEYYNVTPRGNWHGGKNILHMSTTDQAFASQHKMTADVWRDRLQVMRKTVFDVRSKRVPPALDDKILAEWNGLLINGLARASRILDEPRYADAAVRAADFILTEMVKDGRLYRAHRRGVTHIPGYSVDYANVTEALITLYETTFDPKWLEAAERLTDTLIENFYDEVGGGFFYTAHDAERLLVRSKNNRDSVVPSGNSTALLNLLRLSIHLDRIDLLELAEQTMRAVSASVSGGRLERLQWAVIFYHDHPKEIAVIGDPQDPAARALIARVYRDYLPNKVVAVATPQAAARPDAPPLLRRKTLVNGKAAAYVCRDYVCGRPATTANELAGQLWPPPKSSTGSK